MTAGGGTDNITFTSTIDDTTNDSDLDLIAGGGAVDVQGNTGTTQQLSSFTVTSAAQVDLLDVTADGAIAVNARVSAAGAVSLIGGTGVTHAVTGDVDSGGTLDVVAVANDITMADGTVYTALGEVTLQADGSVALGPS